MVALTGNAFRPPRKRRIAEWKVLETFWSLTKGESDILFGFGGHRGENLNGRTKLENRKYLISRLKLGRWD
jgi:hypothetical protein